VEKVKMRIALSALFIFLSNYCLAQNQKIVLKISGLPRQISNQNLSNYSDSLSAYKAIKKEISSLQFIGYFNADVATLKWNKDTLNARIITGDLTRGIYFKNGNLSQEVIIEADLKDKLEKKRALPLQTLNKIYETLLSHYENNGYPFAEVWLDSLNVDSDVASAKIFSNPNQKIIIDTLRLVGNAKINQGFLTSYLGLKKNQNYNEEKVRLIDKKLRDLAFLSVPKPSEVVFAGEKAKINIFLEKQNANQFDGIIGFLPNSNNGKLQLTGDFKLSLQNALKSGESFDFNYRGLPSQSQELAIKLKYPYLFRSQIGFDFDFQLFKRDTSFLNLTSKIAFSYNFNTYQKLSFFLENFSGNQVANQPNTSSGIPTFANIKSTFYGLLSNYVKLDDRITPLKGSDFILQAGVGKRRISPTENFNPDDYFEPKAPVQIKVTTDLKNYIKLNNRSLFYLRTLASYLSGKNLFENEGFRIGGFKTLRGFDEQSLNVSSFIVQTFEFRYIIEKNSYLSAFYDQGFIKKEFINQQYKDHPLGFGLGINFQTKAGVASLNYALGKQKNIPVDLQKGKIHFGITSYF
jgi:outer membrane protein assembly factor BamA